jgi:tetratricopeptide (TPR) repeat protein
MTDTPEGPTPSGAEEHLSFHVLERLLPPTGSDDAARMVHVLQCERCADAALVILELPSLRGPEFDYGEVFARVEEGARRTLAWLSDRRQRAARFVEQVSSLPDEEARSERVRLLARTEPWAVTTALLEIGREQTRTDPERAAELARWAELAAEQMDPELSPPGQRAGLLAQAECLLGDAYRRAGSYPQAEDAYARAAAHLAITTAADLHASYCLLVSRLRRDQGRMDEAVALLHRATTLYEVTGDVVDAEGALLEARELDPIASRVKP